MRHSQDIGKRERLERAARRSETAQTIRDRAIRLAELQRQRPAGMDRRVGYPRCSDGAEGA